MSWLLLAIPSFVSIPERISLRHLSGADLLLVVKFLAFEHAIVKT